MVSPVTKVEDSVDEEDEAEVLMDEEQVAHVSVFYAFAFRAYDRFLTLCGKQNKVAV